MKREIITTKLLTMITIAFTTSSTAVLSSSIGRLNSRTVADNIVSNNIISYDKESAYPYIGYLIDRYRNELQENENGKSYREILKTLYPNGYWSEMNNSSDGTIDVSAVFTTNTDEGIFSIKFRFYLPYDREYSEAFITPTLNGDESSGTDLWKMIIS